MSHIMIDFETLGTKPDSPVLSFGAVKFNDTEITHEYYTKIKPDLKNKEADMSTLRWWMDQGADAKEVFNPEGSINEAQFSSQFLHWVRKHRFSECKVWSNGADFDIPILNNILYDPYPYPFKYGNHRCFRTISRLYPKVYVPQQGTMHNALDDAKWQALYLIELNKHRGFLNE